MEKNHKIKKFRKNNQKDNTASKKKKSGTNVVTLFLCAFEFVFALRMAMLCFWQIVIHICHIFTAECTPYHR